MARFALIHPTIGKSMKKGHPGFKWLDVPDFLPSWLSWVIQRKDIFSPRANAKSAADELGVLLWVIELKKPEKIDT